MKKQWELLRSESGRSLWRLPPSGAIFQITNDKDEIPQPPTNEAGYFNEADLCNIKSFRTK